MPRVPESDVHHGNGNVYDHLTPSDAPPSSKDTLNQAELEAKIKIIKKECDKICEDEKDTNGQPSNFLFFTQYGGEVTAEKLAKDKKTDIDLRLICFTVPSIEKQNEVLAQLNNLDIGFPIELYFHSYDAYSQGRVGETGIVTGLDVIKNDLDIDTITKLKHPSLVSLYTFATMRLFTNRSNEELTTWIATVVNNRHKLQTDNPDFPNEHKISDTQLAKCTLENLKPKNIIEKIKIDKEGIIEWIHMYLKYFLNDYKKFKTKMQQKNLEEETADLTLYLIRLAKYLIRITFGVAIMNRDYDEIKQIYLTYLKGGINPDEAHFSLLTENTSLINGTTIEIIRSAVQFRIAENKIEVENLIDDLGKDKQSDINNEIDSFENALLSIVQKAGGVLRREKFDEVQDFLTELAILNLLHLTPQTEKANTIIIKEGTQGDFLFIIPRQKRDGTPNGKYSINSDGQPISNKNTNRIILGSIGMLTDSETKATASIVAEDDIEIIKISKDMLKTILEKKGPSDENETFLRYYLSGHYNNDDKLNQDENRKNGLLIQSLLSYFSQEFVQYLYERTDAGYSYNSGDEEVKDHMLSSYKIDSFAEVLLEVARAEKIHITNITAPIDEATILKQNTTNEYLYIIIDAEDDGGVKLNFNNGQTTTLKKNGFFGESSMIYGEKPTNYQATLLPGTRVIKIKATDFQKLTMSTKLYEIALDTNDENYTTIETTGSELFFHLGAVLLDRLQNLQS